MILSPLRFASAEAHAALARMEALVEELRDLRHAFSDGMFCSELERIDALLAACERGES